MEPDGRPSGSAASSTAGSAADQTSAAVRATTCQGARVSPPLELRFVTSADRLDRLPESPPEVAVVGRSNVGKSSLINALAKRDGLANTSKTPGRTQLLNCFALPDGETIVDCPGYGYAKVSKVQRAQMASMIERYLTGRDALTMVMVLVDGEVGPTPARPVDARVAAGRGAAPPGRGDQARQGEGGPAREAQAASWRRAATSTRATSCG